MSATSPAAIKAAKPDVLSSVDALIEGLASVGYIASRRIATALYMAIHLQKPILVEGSAGVGKTELALSTAKLLGQPLIRMQCYEGLDESKALYEWKYGKQLLYTQILKDRMGEALPHLTDADWERFARRVFRDDHGVFSLDYDPAISQGFKTAAPASDGAPAAGVPDLWPLFNALAADRPLLLVRGETSDILDADIAGKMSAAAPHMARVEIPKMGHAPTLEEPEATAAITAFFAQAA